MTESVPADISRSKNSVPATGSPSNVGSVQQKRVYKVRGLDCAEEVDLLRRAVGPIVGGGDRLSFDVLNGRMTIAAGETEISEEAILKAIAGTGMSAVTWSPHAGEDAEDRRRHEQTLFTAGSGIALVAGFAIHLVLESDRSSVWKLFASHAEIAMPWPEVAAYVLAAVLGARFVVVKAWFAARNLRPDMHLLMTIAIIGAMAISEWFEAATVSFLFSVALSLEGWSVGRARRAIASLLDLAPPTARVLKSGGAEQVIPASEVRLGSRVIVYAGERIPLDGRVTQGTSAVNQAPITGESVPVEKRAGDEVFAGTISGNGTLIVRAMKTAEDTTLARIIRMVEEAHARRAPSEQWVERFARVYTPIVIGLALLVLLLPPIFFAQAWDEWFYRALVVLVIACPCALVISTPVSIVAALASAARAGVLIKGGTFIELPARLKAIAFDKTGTITTGEPKVVRIVPLNGHDESELLARAAALETRSTHPLARAICRDAETRGLAVPAASDVQMLEGRGLVGNFDGGQFWLGSHRYAVERGQSSPEIERIAENLERQGDTVIAVGNERHVCGLIAVADTLRPEAPDAIRRLHAYGVKKIVLLTGDNRVTGEAIGRAIGADEIHSELLPGDKLSLVEALVRTHDAVAMVGDGVNDAPALARADLGIAMGAIGSDAAIETADVALMTDDISKLPWLVWHSRKTLAVIRENIAVALGLKVIFLFLTLVGMASLWAAIAADMGASLLVVMNGLRLLRASDERVAA